MAVPQQDTLVGELLQQIGRLADELARAGEELRRANLIELHRLFVDQLDRAIGDPLLAEVVSTLDGVSESRRRQMLFANRQYGLILLAYQIGAIDRGELLGALRILGKNAVFAEYWDRTGEHRHALPFDSLEARIGRAVDVIMGERWDDLEEWWVVGAEREAAPPDAPPAGGPVD